MRKTGIKISSAGHTALEQEIIEGLKEGRGLLGKEGVLTPLIKKSFEAILAGEMSAHLGSEEGSDDTACNRRNGYSKKTVKGEMGTFELETPRDREGSFEPQLIKKRQTTLPNALDERILSLFQGGMSYSDIVYHLKDLYDTEISAAYISKVTDQILPVIQEWRERSLQSVYAVVFLDASFFKARVDGKVITRCLYNLIGVDLEGKKEPLGFYIAETEGSKFWLSVLNDLKNRGVEDILIACIDGLKGFPEAIHAVYPQTEIQLCIVHQIRTSLKYVAWKNQKEFMQDLKLVYKAPSLKSAEDNLLALEEKWGQKYPMVMRSWQEKWDELSAYFKYGPEVRRLIYTTNPIEGMHRQIKKYTKTKAAFTSDTALFKGVFCAIKVVERKWNKPIANWPLIASQLDVHFGDRFLGALK